MSDQKVPKLEEDEESKKRIDTAFVAGTESPEDSERMHTPQPFPQPELGGIFTNTMPYNIELEASVRTPPVPEPITFSTASSTPYTGVRQRKLSNLAYKGSLGSVTALSSPGGATYISSRMNSETGGTSAATFNQSRDINGTSSDGLASKTGSAFGSQIRLNGALGDSYSNSNISNHPMSPATRVEGYENSLKDLSLWNLFIRELDVGDYETSQDLKRERVYNFIHVPKELEKMLWFGYFICLDAFISIFTVFPLRVLRALYVLCDRIIQTRSLTPLNIPSLHVCDLWKALIVLCNCILLSFVDSSILYHSIRGQAAIKLYVIFNVLEILDRMCCSFGQDILDSFLSRNFRVSDGDSEEDQLTKTFLSRTHLGTFSHFILSVTYVFIHSIVVFYQAITLNVAINSYNNALLTLLVSNQFVEIKSAVFKKFEKENLFQLACSDVVERFQLSIFLVVIAVRNLLEKGSSSRFSIDYLLNSLLPEALSVFVCEIFVDWLKHAFITKFNLIRPSVYGRFIDVLCKEMVKGQGQIVDHSAVISRRIGFAVIPLACFVLRILFQTLKIMQNGRLVYPVVLIGSFAALLFFKMVLSRIMLGIALSRCKHFDKPEKQDQNLVQPISKNFHLGGTSSVKMFATPPTLETIDRYTLVKSRIP